MINKSRNNILTRIRQALLQEVPVPFPQRETTQLFVENTEDLTVMFAENFTKLQGKFSYCSNFEEAAQQLNQLAQSCQWNNIYCREPQLKYQLNQYGFSNFNAANLADCQASITDCEALIARTGSILLTTSQKSGRNTSVYAPVHICIAHTTQLLYDVKEGLQNIKQQAQLPSLITLATGPSRTADIEKTLVVGVHGPKEVYVFLIESN
jgi:L-lactate dehydrogenase complex protein LldG